MKNANETKTIFRLFVLLLTIGYVATPDYSQAADILIKTVKIKKKHPRTEQGQNTAFQNFDIDEMTITGTPDENAKANGTYDWVFAFAVDIKKKDAVKYANISFTTVYADGKTANHSLTPVLDKKSGLYKATLRDKGFEFIADKAVEKMITLSNTKGDTVFFDATFKKEKDEDNCKKPDIDSLFWKVGDYNKTTQTTPVFFYFYKISEQGGKQRVNNLTSVQFTGKATDSKSNTQTQNTAMKLNESSGWYEGTLVFGTENSNDLETFDELNLVVTNDCGNVYLVSGRSKNRVRNNAANVQIVNNNDDNKDSCNTKYKLKEVYSTDATVSGIYGMSFYFSFGQNSDAPATVEMIVQLINCQGKTQNIKIKLSYNAKTGTYAGGQAMTQDKDCPWELSYGEVYANNPCGDLTWWALDFGQEKTNGAGTRNTASSSQSGRPSLK